MPDTLTLLGHGLDAILLHPQQQPNRLTRLRRYYAAVARQIDTGVGTTTFALRIKFGVIFQDAWRRGLRPDFRGWRR